MPFCKSHFDTEGPFGLPMKNKQAKALETRLRSLPREPAYDFRRLSFPRGLSELQAGERADVSWISEESPDRLGDIVLARGMDDSHFQLNPIVTLNHVYDQPPVGKSLWRKKVKEGELCGIKAKTHYPPRPAAWEGDWLPDYAFELVKAELLRGKSIGFFPLKLRTPTSVEVDKDPRLKSVRYIIEEWLLAEYACCSLPVQPNAVVEQVSKSLPALASGGRQPADGSAASGLSASSGGSRPPLAFTSLTEIEKAVLLRLAEIDLEKLLDKNLQLTYEKARGRV
jgi:hypothetical protein